MRLLLVFIIVIIASSSNALAAISTVSIFSPSNQREISFRVYTPPNYDTTTARYPVVYSLHGIGGTAQNRASQVVPTLEAAILAGTVRPMIYVFPDGQTNSFYGDAFDGHKQVYSNIIGEVLPYLDAHYRTRADRHWRAMEGFSMGGFGAAMYTAKHPELFSCVVEYGGALSTWQDLAQFNSAVAQEMYNTSEANFRPYSLWDLTGQNAATLRAQVSYKMIVGSADGQQQSNVRFRDYLSSLSIDPHYQVLPGITHNGTAYFAEGSGLRFLEDQFARGDGPGRTKYTMVQIPEPGSLALLAIGIVVGLSARARRITRSPVPPGECRAEGLSR